MPKQAPRKQRSDLTANLLVLVLAMTVIALASTPLIALLSAARTHLGDAADELFRPARLLLLARSLLVASLIALLSTLLAYPIARIFIARRTRSTRVLSALMLCPIWLPPFMIYASGNLLRDPGTLAGRALVELATSSPDLRWITIWAGYAVAVIGLAVWAAPIAAVLIASGWGVRSGIYDDLIALEPIGRIRRTLFNLRLRRAVLIRAFVLIAILMLGSAVPLHLAQLDTWSIVTWRSLTEHPPEQWGRVWISAAPMLIIAIIGARLILKILSAQHRHEDSVGQPPKASRTARVVGLMIFSSAVALPLASMLVTLDDPRSIAAFWQRNAQAVTDTALTASLVSAAVLLLALLSAFAFSSPSQAHQRIARHALTVLCVLGLIPGVLIGASIARHGIITIDIPGVAPFWASLTRYAFVGMIIGALGASSESPDRRSARFQIAGASPWAWGIVTLPTFLLPLLATMPVVFLLALFEIESAVLVTPPGIQSLPQQLLSDLHYTRLEQLSAAGVSLLSVGIVFAIGASALISRGFRMRVRATEPEHPGIHI